MKKETTAEFWVNHLGLEKHPEGGYYKESYRADLQYPNIQGNEEFPAGRIASTAIYFLLEGRDFSTFHRILSDELWHFYTGSGLIIHGLDPEEGYRSYLLGPDWQNGEVFQTWVKAGTWFGAELVDKTSFALVGCTVAPGFDFKDFEMAKAQDLKEAFPQQSPLIDRLTRI